MKIKKHIAYGGRTKLCGIIGLFNYCFKHLLVKILVSLHTKCTQFHLEMHSD